MISGEKVILKGITKDSVKKLYDWVNQEDTRVFTGTLYPVSEYEHEEWVRRQVTESDGKLFLICEKRTGNEIGIIGLKHFDYINSNAELFIRIGEEDYRSRTKTPKSEGGGEIGYGTDAVITLINYCFAHLNFHKIYLHVFASNTRAIRCYENAGMKQEGVLLEHHFQNGIYEDVIVMGKVYRPKEDASGGAFP